MARRGSRRASHNVEHRTSNIEHRTSNRKEMRRVKEARTVKSANASKYFPSSINHQPTLHQPLTVSFEIIPFETSAALARTAAQRWLDALAARNNPAAPYCVALSGGRIAREFFAEIARQAEERLISSVHFFWADERRVPPTDPESNYAVANELLFQPLHVPAAQIHRLRGEGPGEL